MSIFPLTKLPFVALKRVIQVLDNMQFIDFACISKKTRKWAKLSKGSHRKLLAVKVDFKDSNSDSNIVAIFEDNFEVGRIFWVITGGVVPLINRNTIRLDSTVIENSRDQFCKKFYIHSKSNRKNDAAFNLCNLLFEIFTPVKLELSTNDDNGSKYIRWDVINKVDYLDLRLGHISTEDFKFFRETILPKKELTIDFASFGNLNDGVTEGLEHEKLNLKWSRWFSRKEIDNLKCRELSCFESSLKPVDLNYMLKKWINDVNWNLEKADIRMKNVSLNVVLDGIEVKTLQALGIWKHFPSVTIKGETLNRDNGSHFTRSDGKIGTVHVQEADKMFYFHAWNK